MSKTLVMTIEIPHNWQAKAITMQISDWLKANKTLMPIENIIILPAKGDTKLYWLEGKEENIKELEEIKNRIEPVLQVALNLKIDHKKEYKIPWRSKPTNFQEHSKKH